MSTDDGKKVAAEWVARMQELQDQRDELLAALKAMVCMSDCGPQPQKFDAALSWRENDIAARRMADLAISRAQRNP